jgi:hypothetical protein
VRRWSHAAVGRGAEARLALSRPATALEFLGAAATAGRAWVCSSQGGPRAREGRAVPRAIRVMLPMRAHAPRRRSQTLPPGPASAAAKRAPAFPRLQARPLEPGPAPSLMACSARSTICRASVESSWKPSCHPLLEAGVVEHIAQAAVELAKPRQARLVEHARRFWPGPCGAPGRRNSLHAHCSASAPARGAFAGGRSPAGR